MHWTKVLALVRPKVVLPRLGYMFLWERMSTMFHVCTWSSMKKFYVNLVMEYLFVRMLKPAIVFGQDDYTMFENA